MTDNPGKFDFGPMSEPVPKPKFFGVAAESAEASEVVDVVLVSPAYVEALTKRDERIKRLFAQCDALVAERDKLLNENGAFADRVVELEDGTNTVIAAAQELAQATEVLMGEFARVVFEKAELEHEYEQLEEGFNNLDALFAMSLQAGLASDPARIAELEAQVEAMKGYVERSENECESYDRRLTKAHERIEQLRTISAEKSFDARQAEDRLAAHLRTAATVHDEHVRVCAEFDKLEAEHIATLFDLEHARGMLREVIASPADHNGVRAGERYVAKRLTFRFVMRIKEFIQ